MPQSPFTLAAYAKAAVTDLHPVGVRLVDAAGSGCDVVDVADAHGDLWTVKAPTAPDGGITLESEVAVWSALAAVSDPPLPFAIPEVAGDVEIPGGGRAIVHKHLPGEPVDVAELTLTDPLVPQLAHAIAALHRVPVSVFDDIGLPNFESAEYRKRRLFELDRAAATGHVPPSLLTRWEAGLEDVSRWRFTPTVIHGDLVADHVLTSNGQLQTVVGWSEAKVADPADDLAWLLVGTEPEVAEHLAQVYAQARGVHDPHVMFRAKLAGELSIARWLIYGLSHSRADVMAEATTMLQELAQDISDDPL